MENIIIVAVVVVVVALAAVYIFKAKKKGSTVCCVMFPNRLHLLPYRRKPNKKEGVLQKNSFPFLCRNISRDNQLPQPHLEDRSPSCVEAEIPPEQNSAVGNGMDRKTQHGSSSSTA